MKRILILISVLLALCFVFASCGGDGGDGDTSSTNSSQTQNSSEADTSTPDTNGGTADGSEGGQSNADSSTGGTTDTSSDLSSGTTDGSSDNSQVDSEVGSTDSSKTDESTDTSTDISSNVGTEDSVSSSNSQSTPSVTEPEEDNVQDGPIDISVGGLTSYVVVYEADNERIEEFANKFVDYMSNAHGITFDMTHDDIKNMPEKCIFIGDVDGAKRVKKRLNSANDFGACVSGDDYVLYATNDRLYEFLYDILVEDVLFLIRGGNWSTKPQKDFIYSQSEYKDVRYVDYLLESGDYGGTTINRQYFLPKIFEDRTYTASDGTVLKYRLYVPYDYDESKEYPVLLLMHGAGERGDNNTGNLVHMLQELFSLDDSPFWDCIIIAPQCPNGEQWVDTPWSEGGYRVDEVPESNENKAVLEILNLVAKTFPTDKDRYYVAGLSMGGFGTWDLIMRHPELFAAAVPLCGGGDYTQASKLVDMPIYTIHDKNDTTVPNSGTKEMYVALTSLGSKVIFYEETSGKGHNVWSYAATKAEIWTWLFEQTREGR